MTREEELELIEGDLDEEDLDEDLEEIEVHSFRGARGFAAGLIVGALVGAGLALLVAPDRGDVVRRKLRRGLRTIQEDARDQLDDWRGDARREFERRRRRLKRRGRGRRS